MKLESLVRIVLSGIITISGISLDSKCMGDNNQESRTVVAEQKSEIEKEYKKCLLSLHDPTKVFDPNIFSVLTEKDPNNPHTHMIMGNALLVSTNIPETYYRAIEEFNKTIKINPNIASVYVNRGIANYVINEPTTEIPMSMITKENMPEDFIRTSELAIKDFDKAIKLNPNLFSAYFNKGVILKYLGKEKEAIPFFEKAIKIGLKNKTYPFPSVANEDDVETVGTGHPMMVVSNFRRYVVDNAFSVQKKQGKIVMLNPNTELYPNIVMYISNENDNIALAYYHMGTAYASANLRDYNPALECLNKAIKLNPDMPFLYFTRGLIHIGNKQTDKKMEDILLHKEVLQRIKKLYDSN